MTYEKYSELSDELSRLNEKDYREGLTKKEEKRRKLIVQRLLPHAF